MARYDVFRTRGGTLVLDIQSDRLSNLSTRVVVPLRPYEAGMRLFRDLMPVFMLEQAEVVMVTHQVAAVPLRELGTRIDNLSAHSHEIVAALDVLLTEG